MEALIRKHEPHIHDTWTRLVSMYSALELTNPHDKLPAIGAVAEEVSRFKQPKDRYLAGLWSNTLAYDLLWYSCASVATNRSSQTAPTWSWASIQSPIRWYRRWSSSWEFQIKVSVQDAACEYKDGNPYGVVGRGQISLCGRLVPCILRRRTTRHTESRHKFYALPSGSLHYFVVYADEEPLKVIRDGFEYLTDPTRAEEYDSHVPACVPQDPTADMMFDAGFERHYELLEIAIATRNFATYCLMVSKSPKDDGTYVRKGLLVTLAEEGKTLQQVFKSAGKVSTCILV